MNAKTDQQIAQRIMTEGERKQLAQEAANLVIAKTTLNNRLAAFVQKCGAAPEDVVMSYGMEKLQDVIITPGSN